MSAQERQECQDSQHCTILLVAGMKKRHDSPRTVAGMQCKLAGLEPVQVRASKEADRPPSLLRKPLDIFVLNMLRNVQQLVWAHIMKEI